MDCERGEHRMRGLKFSGALAAGVAARWLLGSTAALADQVLLCTETDGSGCTANLGGGVPPAPVITVASDGEAAFQPFGVTFDVSDAIQFNAAPGTWVPDASSGGFATGFWQEITTDPNSTTDVWVLPAG